MNNQLWNKAIASRPNPLHKRKKAHSFNTQHGQWNTTPENSPIKITEPLLYIDSL